MGDKECLRCRIEADEYVAFGSKEPELQPHGAQGQSKMEVNQMYPEEGVLEEQVLDNVNQLTTSGEGYFCKKPGHQKKGCRSYASWKTKGSEKRGEHRDVRKFTCYNCNKEGHLARECRGPRKPRRNPVQGNNLESQVAAISPQLAELLTDRKKEEVF